MKYIAKRKGQIQCLQAEYNNLPSDSADATIRWKRFSKQRRGQLKSQLNDEQFFLCAYTEVRPDELGLGTHFEHVKPKCKHPHLTFNYHNLVINALSSDDLQVFKADRFGGHYKGSHYDRRNFISPLKARTRRNYFLYLSDGRVVASPHKTKRYIKKAEHTIGALNLNSPYLVNLRKRWIDELDKLIDEHIEKNIPLSSLAANYLVPVSGKLNRFFSATRQRFGKISEQVLASQAPRLL